MSSLRRALHGILTGLLMLSLSITVTAQATAFTYPAPVEDARRAVRFIRYNAGKYGIEPLRLGGVGGSSGAHLASLLGTMDGAGDPGDPDPVNRESAKLQSIITRAAPLDLLQMNPGNVADALGLFLGMRLLSQPPDKTSVERFSSYKTASEASRLIARPPMLRHFCYFMAMRISACHFVNPN
jgi:hypothetical protein